MMVVRTGAHDHGGIDMGPNKEQEWADRIEDDDEDSRDGYEPTYRDGSAQNECWADDNYTRNPE